MSKILDQMFPNNKLSFSLSIYSPFLSPYLNQSRVILEPAGALAVAGLKKYVQEREITGQSMVAITSGANMDFDRLRFVSERADESEKTLAVKIPESPGSFRQLYSTIWPRNVTEFSYRYESDQEANIFISFQPVINIENDFVNIVEKLEGKGFACSDISHNELAKDHVRHLAGGRSIVPKERLFRFEFPESPGALQRFPAVSRGVAMRSSLSSLCRPDRPDATDAPRPTAGHRPRPRRKI